MKHTPLFFRDIGNKPFVYELFEIDDEMEKLILKSPPISEVQELAVKKGMTTLLQDGLLKVLDGITSVEEVMRVVGE